MKIVTVAALWPPFGGADNLGVPERWSGPFELLMLSALPCGCVAADYRAPSLAVDLIALEAKGPHCTMQEHRAGHVLGLGESVDVIDAIPHRPCR